MGPRQRAQPPPHQRLRQTVTLTSNAPSHMEAGTTWYMNGANSLGLSYEKEIKANGLIEHKHYLSAGGESFALYTQREGNLGGKPAKAVSYFHHDHLGSLAVISKAAGAVIERLAYDPFGKRRALNGAFDQTGAIDATSTNRGFTGHEHLDELDFVHMNARVYDPDIGRFLSADPTVPDASNPQSFNRYSYVINNPLNRYDPSGFADENLGGDVSATPPTSKGQDGDNGGTDRLGNGNAKEVNPVDPDKVKGVAGFKPAKTSFWSGFWDNVKQGFRETRAYWSWDNRQNRMLKGTPQERARETVAFGSGIFVGAAGVGLNVKPKGTAPVKTSLSLAPPTVRQTAVPAKEVGAAANGSDVIHVTSSGVALPPGPKYKIP